MKRTDYNHDNLQGTDACIETSLKEYGLAWIEQDNKILFYYGVKFDDNDWTRFDFCEFEADLDIKSEYDWADFEDLASYTGQSVDEFISNPLPIIIFDMVAYYGTENVFGSTYYEGLTFEEITGHNPDLIEYQLPAFWASALVNGDMSGYDDEDIKQIDAFIADCTDDNGHAFLYPNDDEDPTFMRYHDAKQYGVLACDCLTYSILPDEDKR